MTHYTSDNLIDYLHGELGVAVDAQVYAHLAECPDCRRLADDEAMIADSLRAAAQAVELELPSLVKARVWEAIRTEQPSLVARLRATLNPFIMVSVALALAAFVLVGIPVMHASGVTPRSVAATYYLDEHAIEGQAEPLADRQMSAATATALTPASVPLLVDAASASTRGSVVPDGALADNP
jgi:anti-sigma factor RsiW